MKKDKYTPLAYVDTRTGEIKHGTSEPDFVKLYIKHFGSVMGLGKNDSPVLYNLLSYMGYDHKIYVTGEMKQSIGETVGFAKTSAAKLAEQSIKRIREANIICRQPKTRGVYFVNPYLIGKGRWDDIKRMQETGNGKIKFCIEYEQGRTSFTVEAV